MCEQQIEGNGGDVDPSIVVTGDGRLVVLSRFVPLRHRANTCREACSPPSPLERNCRQPWEDIAPFVDAATALCGGSSSMLDAGTDAGSDAGPELDRGDSMIVDASPVTPTPMKSVARSASGCTVAFARGAIPPRWLAPVLMLVGWLRSLRSLRR